LKKKITLEMPGAFTKIVSVISPTLILLESQTNWNAEPQYHIYEFLFNTPASLSAQPEDTLL
jgi:hypothetical protein